MLDKYSVEEYERLKGKTIYGKVSNYTNQKGYGYIRTEDNKEIFFNSFEFLKRKEQKNLYFGSTVRFKLGFFNNRVCATEIELIQSSMNDIILFSEDISIRAKHIIKFGLGNFYNSLTQEFEEDDIRKHGYNLNDFDYIYFRTHRDERRFYQIGSPIQGDGQLDITSTLFKLDKYLEI